MEINQWLKKSDGGECALLIISKSIFKSLVLDKIAIGLITNIHICILQESSRFAHEASTLQNRN